MYYYFFSHLLYSKPIKFCTMSQPMPDIFFLATMSNNSNGTGILIRNKILFPTGGTVVHINDSSHMVHVNVERTIQLTHIKAVQVVVLTGRCEDHRLNKIYLEARRYQENPGFTPPWGFEPGSLVTGSKRVVHWTNETW